MKKILYKLLILTCIGVSGCGAFANTLGKMGSERPPNHWDGTGYKRSKGVGTGIDPQAKEIEERLGYSSETF